MKGKVTIRVLDARDEKELKKVVVDNLILTAGYAALTRVLAGDVAATHYVNRMQFGTGTATPAAGDVSLGMPITPIKTIVTVTEPTPGDPYTLQLETYLLADEGNGFPISEAGLLTPANELAARAIFASLTKTSSYIFHFSWLVRS